ncbi:contractile injection system protein, VgrG/Pvc8 family, partial [Succinimonas sp.]|uniref:contractile injection system protein, VgrG/Pvc8 family n=1 Tax=Succinimonas sp. TaxID=1936151 RepID=UPI0038633922
MFKKEITAAFIKNCPLSGAFAFRCAVSEGISLPFRAEVALFSDTELTPEDLESCLLVKTELTLMQYDTTGALSRGRKFQGVITSYNALGLISDPEGYELLTDCYGYEIVIEPEMALMGLEPRTRRFDSGKTPAEIITEIFGEYQQKCLFDPKLFDKMPECGQIVQQSNETDLSFINRICFNCGFNYIFELEAPEEEFSGISVVFSRGYRTGNGHEITGNTHSGRSEIPCRTGKTGNRLFADSAIFLDRLVRTGIAGSGSIRKNAGTARNKTPLFRNGFEPVRGEGNHPGESIDAFIRESSAALDRLSRNRTLITARDFAVASGITLDTGKTRYLTVRTRFSFNLNFPKIFRKAQSFPANENELSLAAVAVPVPENTGDTLGPLCCFGPIPENPAPATAFVITDMPRPGRESLRAGGQDLGSNAILKEDAGNNAMIVRATVSDKSGSTTDSPGTVVISENDDTAFPALFYALPEGGSVIEANYVSMSGSASPLGNFPKVGEKVLLLYTGSSYYFMGYLPNGSAFRTYSAALRNDLLHSSFLNSGYDPDSAANAAGTDKVPTNANRDIKNQYLSFSRFSSSAALVEYIIMQNRLELFMKCLAYKFNTNKVTEVYDDCKDKISSNLEDVISKREDLDKAVQDGSDTKTAESNLNTAYTTLSQSAADIVTKIKDITDVNSQINSIYDKIKNDENNTRYTGTDDEMKDQILGDLLGAVSGDLFYDGTHRIYGNRLENAATDDITSVAEGNINLHADKKLYLTADDAIQLQVGNNTISINGNTIALAAAYFRTSLFPWDSKITLSPTGGVKISGCQFSANGFISATVSDSLGGSVGTKNGLMSMTAPKIKITNMSGPALLKTLGKLADNLVFGVGNLTANLVNDFADVDNADLAATIVNDVNGYANNAFTLAGDIWAAVERFRSTTNSVKNIKSWINIAPSLILIAADVFDTLDSIV